MNTDIIRTQLTPMYNRESRHSKASPKFDAVVANLYQPAPPVLYHYTKWEHAEGVLSKQHFRATAHDAMKDQGELAQADSAIMAVAKDVQDTATGVCAELLSLFVANYPALQVRNMLTACLVCFSHARDDMNQWELYSDKGSGVCLGVRIEKRLPSEASEFLRVDYSEDSWRNRVRNHFVSICSISSKVKDSIENREEALNAFYRIAAITSIQAKNQAYVQEQEYRHVTLVTGEARNHLSEWQKDGRTIRYKPVSISPNAKLIPFSEIILGPHQDLKQGRARLKRLLAASGYTPDIPEYPKISDSQYPNRINSMSSV